MSKLTDKQILEIKNKIEDLKSKLERTKKPTWQAGASFEVFGERHNLHLCNTMDQLSKFTAHLHSYFTSLIKAHELLGITKAATLKGFTYAQWLQDIFLKRDIIKAKHIESRIKKYEDFLNSQLSEDYTIKQTTEEILNFLENNDDF